MSKRPSSTKRSQQSALTKSMQSDDSSSDDSKHISSRPSVLDMANAFQKMGKKTKKRANSSSPKKRRNMKSPKKFVTSAGLHHSRANDIDDKSDELISQFKEFDMRKSQNKIKKLESSLKRKNEEIEELQCLVEEQQEKFRKKIQLFKHKDDKIRKISDEVHQENEKNQKLHKEINDLRKENRELIVHKKDSNKKIQAMNKELIAFKKDSNKKNQAMKQELIALKEDSDKTIQAKNEELAFKEDSDKKIQAKNKELIAFKEDSNKKIQEMNKEISSLNEEIKRKLNENRKLSKDKMALSQQKRMEDHVINIANYEELKQYAEKLENELRNVKVHQVGDILKKEKSSIKVEKLSEELAKTRRSLTIRNSEYENLQQSFARISLYKTHNPNDTVFNKQSLGKIKNQITSQRELLNKTKKKWTKEIEKMQSFILQSLQQLSKKQQDGGDRGGADSILSVLSLIPANNDASSDTTLRRLDALPEEKRQAPISPQKKSAIAKAVGSLDNLFSPSDLNGNHNLRNQIARSASSARPIPVTNRRPSNLALSIARSESLTPRIRARKFPEASPPESVYSSPYVKQMDSMAVELQHKDDEIRHKDEMLERLSDEVKIYRDQVCELRQRLHYEEKLAEVCSSNHHIEQILSTFEVERQQHSQQMNVMQSQLNSIVRQNQELRKTVQNVSYRISHSLVVTESSLSDEPNDERKESTSVDEPLNLPVSVLSDRSFSEVFLEQISMQPPKEESNQDKK